MTEQIKADICVIGAGSGGLSVAAAAAAFGEKVVLLEKAKMGGDCLNYGCVPSKAMIAAGKQAQTIRDAVKFGVSAGEPEVNYQAVHDHIHSVIAAIEPNDSVERFEGLGVQVIQQAGKFKDAKTVVTADGKTEITARHFVISTGSSAAKLPIEGLDDVNYLTNETVFDLTEQPKKLVIIGGGPIGMELAQAQRRLGTDVTVLEAFNVLGKDDPELTAVVIDQIRRDGVELREGAKILRVEKGDEAFDHSAKIILEGEDGEEDVLEATHLMVAAGRAPNVNGLDLEKANITYDKRGIKVKDTLKTTNRRVFAIGDVTGGLQFTHVAGYHAGLVIRSILFRMTARENRNIIPWVTYTAPEMAHVGMNEEQAKQKHRDIRILRWPYGENDRAQAERKTAGLIKIVTDKRGNILGASIVGENAGEMINMWSLIISQKMNVKAITGYISPYPTLSEIGRRAAISYYGDLPKKPMIRRTISFFKFFG
ncbi:dihydrolipoyl dehydrogenase family protein [Cohaesibacter gelatinilyticus]|uniref:Pyruvate/2-oxoglutarate dehydrogenase complex, dihydrolipoamide dehydrogenase (E3) component n=1 Tax=Cohaesibacter gelatinilyticus TaxID=372072 RepID=A0A285PJG9_9HYPH|nr:FAD-dependent oxidoreductase [Cohaesibacter gelatinilyticus]SNZ20021.1 Pyruvate/2-oxoglutarate dehydrogenase complex, dihydrolipoamide dehydrogenase (E3) component [Cohaesibacter gelatinilyticus]HAT87305.1 FAD-binding protein [Hyphomicrobiales bacterium]